MTLRYLLDTNIVSYYIRRQSAALDARMDEGLSKRTLAISTITRAELRFGMAAMSHDDKRRGLIDRFMARLPNLPWTALAADRYGDIRSWLKIQGTPIGELDTQIAAQALAEKLILVTHNSRHFDKVPLLTLEDWMV